MPDKTPDSDAKAIARYFNGDAATKVPLGKFMEEYKALTDEDKKQLGEGIRNETLTY